MDQQLSRGGAMAMGLLFIFTGGLPLLLMMRGVQAASAHGDPSPPWLAVAIGAMFVCAGVVIILEYAVGRGVDASGDLIAGTPFALRVSVFVLVMSIIGMLDAAFIWVAFGPGARHFSGSISIPFLTRSTRPSDLSGRIAFGVCSAMTTTFVIAYGVMGVKRLRGWHKERK